jgi:hypothetical protein
MVKRVSHHADDIPGDEQRECPSSTSAVGLTIRTRTRTPRVSESTAMRKSVIGLVRVWRGPLVMHILVPSFTTAHKSKHDECIRDADVVLVMILSRTPLCQAENLNKHDGKEHEQNQPQCHQTEDNGKT